MSLNIVFRRVRSCEDHDKLVAFLTQDVVKNGGSAGEVVDMHGHLWDIRVCRVPWGTLLLKREVSELEAVVLFYNA